MKWLRVARRMVSQLKADLANHRMLADPWQRAVHNMVQACRIRDSQRQGRTPRKSAPPCQTWREAARRMIQSLDSRAREQSQKGTWAYWAAHRPPPTRRYVRKSLRSPASRGSSAQPTSCGP